MGNCNKCGTQNRDGAKYCRNCGNPLEQKQKTRGGFGIPILAVFGILLAFGVIYAFKVGFGGANYDDDSRFNDEAITVAEKNNEQLPAPVQKLLDDMVYVEGGTFMMLVESVKYDEEVNSYKTIWEEERTTVLSFYICRYEVTQELWQAIMGDNPSHYSRNFDYLDDLRRPVESITRNECQEFIEKLNKLTGKHFRLPWCSEWQYAAKGGIKSKGFRYAGSNDIDEVAWLCYYDDILKKNNIPTHPVGTKKENELGLYDMNGNVSEMTSDRVLRNGEALYYYCGGGWSFSSLANDANDLDADFRANYFELMPNTLERDNQQSDIGFRLAMSADANDAKPVE